MSSIRILEGPLANLSAGIDTTRCIAEAMKPCEQQTALLWVADCMEKELKEVRQWLDAPNADNGPGPVAVS